LLDNNEGTTKVIASALADLTRKFRLFIIVYMFH
jgi:hypothetical protein